MKSNNRLITRLSDNISLIGTYTPEGNLWGIKLVACYGHEKPKFSEGSDSLPSQDCEELGGFKAFTYVDLNMGRHYRVQNTLGARIWEDSLT
jgi:hypothetical protein